MGQENGLFYAVNGLVQDAENHAPLQFVTVSLRDIVSGELIGDVTDKMGHFEMNVPEGKYYCIVESLSFQPFVIDVLSIRQDIDMDHQPDLRPIEPRRAGQPPRKKLL